MLTSYNVFWCMLEGSQGSVGVPVLESEGILAVVGDGVTVTAGRSGVKWSSVPAQAMSTARFVAPYSRDRRSSGIPTGSPLPLPWASPEPDQLPLPSMPLPLSAT